MPMLRSEIARRYLILSLSGPLLFLNIWLLGQIFGYFQQVITIVTLAAILALLLNYLVDWLEYIHLRRVQAVVLVALLMVTLLIVTGLTVIPTVIDQATQLLKVLPDVLKDGTSQVMSLNQWADNPYVVLDLNQITEQVGTLIQRLLELLPALAIDTIGRLFDMIIVIVLAFYMLLYGQKMWQGLVKLLPANLGPALSVSLQFNFQQFFISQLLLAAFMLVALIPVFELLRVKFSLLLALTIAISQLIPFIGATLGIGLVTLLVMLQGFWLAVQVAIAAILLQQIKDNLIAPKLLGDFIGLSPIWVFIALLIGARVAGLLGLLLAIPIAGTIKSTVEHMQAMETAHTVSQFGLPAESFPSGMSQESEN